MCFLTLLLVSQLHYEKRIQKFVLRNEEELTEFTKNYLAVEQRERRHMFEEWKEENGYSVQLLSLIHISEPTRRTPISYAVFCLKKKNK